jgi:pimeloyl-ACP methyl ester carboxylesterase
MVSRKVLLTTLLHCAGILAATNVFILASAADQAEPSMSSRAIDEKLFVPIGGIDQWITIKGQDRHNPVVLFLHGGPGDPLSPYADSIYGPAWQQSFTLVQWDQRGAGRTYGKSGASIGSTLTIDRMAKDGIEVAEYLTKHLHHKKIIITGGSWGSILGVYTAKTRPDLFYAYVGTAQVVNMKQNPGYEKVLTLARAAGDQKAIGELEAMGPPPWDALRKLGTLLRWQQVYEAKRASPVITPHSLSAEYAGVQDRADYAAGEELSFVTFFGATLSGPIMQVDLPALGANFAIPVFIIQGQEDLRAPPEIAKAYFDRIKAPQKQFFVVPGSSHEPSRDSTALLLKVLLEQVRPLALEHPTER